MTNKKQASIIIRTYNEEESIKACLTAVFNQKTNFSFEVIIVDSESKDQTVNIAKKFSVEIITIKKKNFSYGRALNLGCAAAKGKYFVFLSAHAIPANNHWLTALINNFKKNNIVGAYGKQVPTDNCNPLTKRQMLAHWKDKKKIQTTNHFFSNANSAIRKKTWLKINFNEQLIGSEDHLWAKTVQEKGYNIVYEPKAVVSHSHNETLKQIFSRYHREILANRFIYKTNLFHYLSDSLYNLYHDIKYIIIDRQNFFWILKSFVNNCLLFMAAILAFSRKLK